jgi:toxin ParE1/3/4
MTYSVEVTDAAFEALRAQARYIALECQSPLNAARWLEQVWDVIDGLQAMPSRHNLADEDAFKSYEVRRALLGDYLILFTIDEDNRKVWVIGFRHCSRLPRPDDLPNEQPERENP